MTTWQRDVLGVALGCSLAFLSGCGSGTPSSAEPQEAAGSVDPSATPGGDPPGAAVAATNVVKAGEPVLRGSIQATTAAGPLEIVPETIDFGAVPAGSINSGMFKITNRGDRSVRVLRVTPSCVCTTLTDLAGTVIPAGGTVDLMASLDAPKQPGEKQAKVFVQLEGMQRPAIVRLDGMVTLPIQPEPTFASALEGVESGVIRLAAIDGRPFTILGSNGVLPDYVDFDPARDAPRSAYDVRWSITGLPGTRIPRWWVFTTDRADSPLVACRVRHTETGSRRDPTRFDRRWILADDFVELGAIRAGDVREITVTLDHYNPRGGNAVDRPEWMDAMTVRSLDRRLEAELVSMTPKSPTSVEAVLRLRSLGGVEPLLYAPVAITTATGMGVLEIAARVDP